MHPATPRRRRPGALLAALSLVPVVAAPVAASAQSGQADDAPPRVVAGALDAAPRPTARAARTTGPVRVDGRLDEPAWAGAQVIDRFVQQKPDVGALATERTEVRILYDDENFYIGAELHDSDPDGIIVPTLQRDSNTRDGDAFGITLDTFHDGLSSFAFVINPGGAVRDIQTSDDGRTSNAEWQAVYDLETRVHDGGWTLELAIPWSTLRFDGGADEQVWGLNLLRRVRRKNEDAVWAPMDRQWPLYTVSRAGVLRGIRGVRPGRNLTLKPYVLAGEPSGLRRADEETELDAGLDLKYGITSGLTLDLTWNTDFSQVEADQQRVNLTRFSLFFPEKREFFLENAGVFQFGDQGRFGQRNPASNRDFTLFHSRRIGLTPGGTPLPILGGGRISGVAGPVSIGLLNMQVQELGELEPENFTVARVRGTVAPGLSAGGILTNRTVTSGAGRTSRSWGVDADWQTFNDYLLVQTYLAATEGDGVEGATRDRGWAGRLSAAWRDPFWEVVASYRRFDDDFTPDVGFVRRTGVRHGYGSVGVHPRFDGLVQELNPYVETHYYADLDGRLVTREITGGVGLGFADGSMGSVSVADGFERVEEPFTVSGALVPAGAYDARELSANYTASRARTLSGNVRVTAGDYFGGSRVSLGGGLGARLGAQVLLDLSVNHNRLDLPDAGAVTADVYGVRLDYFFSTRLLTSAFVQYNQAADQLVSNVRLNWIHAPLSDLYLVFSEVRDTDGDEVLDRLVSLKVTKLLGF